MKYVFASRTGNVESMITKLNIEAIKIESGSEVVEEEYVLFTYTDGFGDVPYEVDAFLSANPLIQGVLVSGDRNYGEAFCKAGDVISEQYGVDVLYRFENDGTDEDVQEISKIISQL